MGADEAVIYSAETDQLGTATILAGIIRMEKYDMIICGEASIDEYSFQVGPRLAEILGIPVLTYVRKVELKDNEVVVERELENNYEVAGAELPVLITVNKDINEPGIPTLIQILGASKRKMTDITPESTEMGVETLSIQAIEMKRKEIMLEDVEKLSSIIISEK